MIPMTLGQVAQAVAGTLVDGDPQALIDVVTTDSRQAGPGALFVAILGETHDGHDYAEQAHAQGAAASLVSRTVPGPHILVDDTLRGVGGLAHAVIDLVPDLRVVALTGSSGKTSTKDMLRVMLTAFAPTVAPQGSFNNELGLPRTVFEVTDRTRYLVAEMGARGAGHIAYLCDIAEPDVSLLLNVGHAHLSEFGSREGIAQAKAEILSALRPEGVAVLNADDQRVMQQAAKAPGRVVTFGQSPAAEVRITDLQLDDGKPVVTLRHGQREVTVALGVHGEHQGFNLAAALATAVALGLDFEQAAAAMQGATLDSRWRMEVSRTTDGVTIINDAYNANPESTAAGLRALAAMGRGHTTWAVLGEMRELGDAALTEHDAIGRLCVRLNISRLIAVGDGAKPIHMGAAHEGSWGRESMFVPDVDAALQVLRAELEAGDYVLVKASRAVGLERIAQALLEGAGS